MSRTRIFVVDESSKKIEIQIDAKRESQLEALRTIWECIPRREDDSAIGDVAAVIRLKLALKVGDLKRAREAADFLKPVNAEALNLLGVVNELEGNFELARRMYQRALALDLNFGAAELNLMRDYELFTFGNTVIPICL